MFKIFHINTWSFLNRYLKISPYYFKNHDVPNLGEVDHLNNQFILFEYYYMINVKEEVSASYCNRLILRFHYQASMCYHYQWHNMILPLHLISISKMEGPSLCSSEELDVNAVSKWGNLSFLWIKQAEALELV